ncbi:hypothetical protein FJW04_19720 [Mesorhizobium sp. B2-7-3]|uniref:hypothetical protein n=1 Tax=Mesorhizobium sp. B2-7-3 TaxID=2589907 RepID=UPI00112A9591|nr:hypothetical protein [Mesorhizobium sp. B2-7-3]TPJ13823.1 hypothetical protein FJW04_19720 [Mesorhizobium sp. B2-7-3]
MVARHFTQAVEALTEAIALNPSLAIAHMMLGSTYGYGGMPDDGLHRCAWNGSRNITPWYGPKTEHYTSQGSALQVSAKEPTASPLDKCPVMAQYTGWYS